eukprot:scaffold136434_cov69-Attheya_sp.AAC.1
MSTSSIVGSTLRLKSQKPKTVEGGMKTFRLPPPILLTYGTVPHSPAIGGEDDVSKMSNGKLGITSTREMYRRGG